MREEVFRLRRALAVRAVVAARDAHEHDSPALVVPVVQVDAQRPSGQRLGHASTLQAGSFARVAFVRRMHIQ